MTRLETGEKMRFLVVDSNGITSDAIAEDLLLSNNSAVMAV
eukprot:CAMPEP_0183704556 /NCGR_PEP_ID=MMETSP0737-20130205/1855_1 /TAXON_ID=385413 /ORGANISM="Thalassiosira miniscula, Strain CCMP1093" /LENGTH=40 /DNA_ID= /DNA_START= /DNA_END= /DNA_ORIENTATION=